MSAVSTLDIRASLSDRIVGLFSPARANERIQAKYSAKYMDALMRGAFKASEVTRHNSNWISSESDINQVLAAELPRIRARSRWLVRNNAYAKSALNTFINYCVGLGFDLQMSVYKTVQNGDEFDVVELDSYNDYVEDVFSDWCTDVHISAPESCPDNFRDVQRMAFQRMIEDGEVFIHLVPDKVKILQVEFIEPEALDTFKTSGNSGNPVILGVEVDKNTWKPVAYWVRKATAQGALVSNVFQFDSVRVPAEDMIHAFVRQYPRQMRGLPWMHAVTEEFFQLGEYKQAITLRNKIAALFAVLFKGGKGVRSSLISGDDSGNAGGSSGFPTDANGNPLSNLSPGMMGSLPDGVEPFMVNPTAPENTFDMFCKSQLVAIGAGMQGGMSYQGLTRDTSQTTFASGRASGQMDMQAYRPIQRMIGEKICSPIFRRWFDLAVLAGNFLTQNAASASYMVNPKFWTRHGWLPGGWSWGINPVQEVTAAVESMKAGITSLQDECSALGLDWKVQLRKRAKCDKFAERLGLNFSAMLDQVNVEKMAAIDPALQNPQEVNVPSNELAGVWLT